jgi:prophage tail gpP-like protein
MPNLSGLNDDDFTLVVSGRKIPVKSAKLSRSMDSAADGAVCLFAWYPGDDPLLDKYTLPFSYNPAQIYLGRSLQLDGIIYDVKHESSDSGTEKELGIYSKTVDLVDSCILPPHQYENVNIKQMATQVCSPFGINVLVDSGIDIGGPFYITCCRPEETAFQYISKYALQRQVLVSNDVNSNLMLTKAKTTLATGGLLVGTLQEGNSPGQKYEMFFKGRGRYKTYRALSHSPKKIAGVLTATDSVVTRNRVLTFKAPDLMYGELQDAAIWKRNRTLAEMLSLPFPVSTWYSPIGQLWQPNTLVNVVSKTIGTKKGFTFLIRQVEFVFDDKGTTALLSLIPPECYTEGKIQEPWVSLT